MPNVGLVKKDTSYEAVRDALELIRDDVQIPDNKPVLVKPNMVSASIELCATPVNAVRATLDFLKSKGVEKFVIGEGTAGPDGDTMGGFERYGYFALERDYDVEFRNLNENEWLYLEALGPKLEPVTIRLARTYFTHYIVSVARMKTHLQAIVTLSLKNTAISSIHNTDRHSGAWHTPMPGKFSHDPRPINLNLARLLQVARADLAVIDGVVGMEGEGPVKGTPVRSGVALAGTDPLAVDTIGTEVMGFDPRTVGYLWYLSELEGLKREDINVVGEKIADCVTRYKPYQELQRILGWWVENWREFLEGNYLSEEAPAA